ncbi:MAG: glycoside hydrolase family 25 protein [Erythrobacter sp.]|jgi:lysozyme|nr:glycoside hydrolase family 25 protein [Erythrobacter sp.]
MARKARGKQRRKPRVGLLRRLFQLAALVVLLGLIYAAWFWFDMRSWRPDPALYPEQGAVIASGAPGVRFETLRAVGAQFVYLELPPEDGAGDAGESADPGFRERFRAARAAGLKVGVVQRFDPCRRADPQSQRFALAVARDPDLLPPALELTRLPDSCEERVSEAAVTSEVLTLVNQIEMHAGQPVILKLGEAFENRLGIANALGRDLWLMRDRSPPRYAGRPWLLWSANSQLVTEGAAEPLEWVVVQR